MSISNQKKKGARLLHWNYRIGVNSRSGVHKVYEVYYDKNGKPEHISNPVLTTSHDNIEDLIKTLETMLDDIKRSKSDVIIIPPKKRR